MNDGGDYTREEVAVLLGMSGWDALQRDIHSADSTAGYTSDGRSTNETTLTSGEPDPIPALARWSEVHRARQAIIERRLREDGLSEERIRFESRILWLIAAVGLTNREAADRLGVAHTTVSRTFKAGLAAVLSELGAQPVGNERTSSVPACMRCATRPRARLREITRKRAGKPPELVSAERLSSLCAFCTPIDRLHLLVDSAHRRERCAELGYASLSNALLRLVEPAAPEGQVDHEEPHETAHAAAVPATMSA